MKMHAQVVDREFQKTPEQTMIKAECRFHTNTSFALLVGVSGPQLNIDMMRFRKLPFLHKRECFTLLHFGGGEYSKQFCSLPVLSLQKHNTPSQNNAFQCTE